MVKIQLSPNLRERVLSDQTRKNYSFLNQSIVRPKLCNISKNYPPRSIRTGNMRVSSLFDFKKELFLFYLHAHAKLSQEFGIWYVKSVVIVDVNFGGFDFSAWLPPPLPTPPLPPTPFRCEIEIW